MPSIAYRHAELNGTAQYLPRHRGNVQYIVSKKTNLSRTYTCLRRARFKFGGDRTALVGLDGLPARTHRY